MDTVIEPPSVAQHTLLNRLRRQRADSDLFELTQIEAVRALAASERTAVHEALALARAKEKLLRIVISEQLVVGNITKATADDLLSTLR